MYDIDRLVSLRLFHRWREFQLWRESRKQRREATPADPPPQQANDGKQRRRRR